MYSFIMAKVWRIIEPDLYTELMCIYTEKLLQDEDKKDLKGQEQKESKVVDLDSRASEEEPVKLEPQTDEITEETVVKPIESSACAGVQQGGSIYDDGWQSLELIRKRAAGVKRPIKKPGPVSRKSKAKTDKAKKKGQRSK